MCKCQDENNKPCYRWVKWVLIGIGLTAVAGAAYWYWKNKRQAA